MNREEAKEILTSGGVLCVDGTWNFLETYMCCLNDNCCSDYFSNVDESLDSVEHYSDYGWNKVCKV